MNELNETELEVLKIAARDAYYLRGQVEIANRKLETAFVAFEKAKEYRQKGYRHWKKSLWWFAASSLWLCLSTVMWILR